MKMMPRKYMEQEEGNQPIVKKEIEPLYFQKTTNDDDSTPPSPSNLGEYQTSTEETAKAGNPKFRGKNA